MSQLRVWWVPQVPMNPFYVNVDSVEEGVKIIETLAQYDLFQYYNNVKPDYSNAGGIEMMENGEWVGWYHEEDGECFEDPEEYVAYLREQRESS